MTFNRTKKKYLGLVFVFVVFAFLGWYLAGSKIKGLKETRPASSVSLAPSPSPSVSEEAPSLSNFDLLTKKGDLSKLGGNFLITDIRFSSEEGFERLTLDLSSSSLLHPYYQVREVDTAKEPILTASGETVADLGPFILEAILSDTRNFDIDKGEATYSKDKVEINGVAVDDVRLIPLGDDNNSRIVINLKKESPFFVSVLSSPWRIVVDVQL